MQIETNVNKDGSRNISYKYIPYDDGEKILEIVVKELGDGYQGGQAQVDADDVVDKAIKDLRALHNRLEVAYRNLSGMRREYVLRACSDVEHTIAYLNEWARDR